MAALGREHRHLQPLVEMGNKLEKYEHELAETRELVDSDDPEMAQEAKAEAARLRAEGVEVGTVLELHGHVRLLDVYDPDGNRIQLAQDLI